MKLSAPPPPPPPPSDGPGENTPASPDEQPNPTPPVADAPGSPQATGEPQAAGEPGASATGVAKPKQLAWPSWFAGVDSAIVGLVLVFTFVAASFVARNSDVWLHLAAGKRLFTGEYFPGGNDPFSYSAADRTWVNHSWLTDAVSYLLYGGSGKVLVFAKALLVTLTFGLLIAIRRPKFSLWPWAVVACVGVLAATPQFTLRPLVVSMLLLAVTLFLLFRMPHKRDSWRFPAAIGVTFWVWANCDQWFFVGPLALALLLVGDLIRKYGFNIPDETEAETDAEPLGPLPDTATLAKALGIGVLACLLTPHHFRVLEIPFELIGASGAKADPRVQIMLYSPTDDAFLNSPGLGYNVNGLAYATLLIVGGGLFGAIFGLGLAKIRIPHIALWLGFAVLTLGSVYTIPFFAIVAVPLLASQLNGFSTKAELKTWGDPRSRLLVIGSSGGRVLSVLAVCLLCVLAYPGWVHPDSSSPVYARRVAWAVEPDPVMVQAAEQLKKWRDDDTLPADARGVIAHTDLANYVAWYAPKEKVLLNTRFNHHRRELPDYLAVRRGLGLIQIKDELPALKDATDVLGRRNAEYVVVHANLNDNRGQLATRILYRSWGEWSVWYLDGRTTVFGWRPEPHGGKPSFAKLGVNPSLQAFGPGVVKLPETELKYPLPPVGWEEAFVRTPRAAPPGAAEAMGWLTYKESLVAREQVRRNLSMLTFFSVPATQRSFHQLAVLGADANGVLRFPPAHSDTPSDSAAMRAIPLLALRAARRAIAEDPDHPDAYYALGRVYLDPDLPLSESERALGMATAYRQCLNRLPAPDRYKRGQFAVFASDVARELAIVYLGRPFVRRDPVTRRETVSYSGMPIDLPPLGDLFGQTILQTRQGTLERVPTAAIRGRPLSSDVQLVANGTPFLLPIDLARESLQLALKYAPVDIAGERGEEAQAHVKEVEAHLREVENEVIRYKGQYDAGKGPSPKLPDLVNRAIQNCMIGEALRLLSDKDTDLNKEFGQQAAIAAVLRVGMELATGRVEDASENLKVLSSPDTAGALEQSGMASLVQLLKYQKAIVAGEYKTAGELWESLNGNIGAFDKFPPLGPTVPLPTVQRTVQAISRGKDPAKILPMMLTPQLVMTPGHAQIISLQFWFGNWFRLGQVIQDGISEHLVSEANFFYRRGVLFLFEGDIPAAKERFKETLRKPPPGWGIPNVLRSEAADYLKLIETAEKAAGR